MKEKFEKVYSSVALKMTRWFLWPTPQENGANILMVFDFRSLFTSYNCLIITVHLVCSIPVAGRKTYWDAVTKMFHHQQSFNSLQCSDNIHHRKSFRLRSGLHSQFLIFADLILNQFWENKYNPWLDSNRAVYKYCNTWFKKQTKNKLQTVK